eukprot:TRINITY_DN12924_c0_g2_i4.p1 TRINITY_DN12924_c0_g2~~TRINITY_DN12924_c0_g2_i4.p1  ORF type:complete len:554 (-),score=149.46 TRINITY_DN12924_c0_g2_i4:67-1728(-)
MFRLGRLGPRIWVRYAATTAAKNASSGGAHASPPPHSPPPAPAPASSHAPDPTPALAATAVASPAAPLFTTQNKDTAGKAVTERPLPNMSLSSFVGMKVPRISYPTKPDPSGAGVVPLDAYENSEIKPADVKHWNIQEGLNHIYDVVPRLQAKSTRLTAHGFRLPRTLATTINDVNFSVVKNIVEPFARLLDHLGIQLRVVAQFPVYVNDRVSALKGKVDWDNKDTHPADLTLVDQNDNPVLVINSAPPAEVPSAILSDVYTHHRANRDPGRYGVSTRHTLQALNRLHAALRVSGAPMGLLTTHNDTYLAYRDNEEVLHVSSSLRQQPLAGMLYATMLALRKASSSETGHVVLSDRTKDAVDAALHPDVPLHNQDINTIAGAGLPGTTKGDVDHVDMPVTREKDAPLTPATTATSAHESARIVMDMTLPFKPRMFAMPLDESTMFPNLNHHVQYGGRYVPKGPEETIPTVEESVKKRAASMSSSQDSKPAADQASSSSSSSGYEAIPLPKGIKQPNGPPKPHPTVRVKAPPAVAAKLAPAAPTSAPRQVVPTA